MINLHGVLQSHMSHRQPLSVEACMFFLLKSWRQRVSRAQTKTATTRRSGGVVGKGQRYACLGTKLGNMGNREMKLGRRKKAKCWYLFSQSACYRKDVVSTGLLLGAPPSSRTTPAPRLWELRHHQRQSVKVSKCQGVKRHFPALSPLSPTPP